MIWDFWGCWVLGEVVSSTVKGRKPYRKLAEFTQCSNEKRWSALFNSLYFLGFFCNWLLTKVICLFVCFSVLPVRAPNLTMQCAQIQINHHYAGLWTGHEFHPQFPSFATCSKVCADASETKWALVCWKTVHNSIKMTTTLCVVLSLLCSLKNVLHQNNFLWLGW